MMGGDSSIYSGNGVGAASEVMLEGRNDMGSRSSQESRCVLLLFFCRASCFVDALPTNLKACGRPQPGVKSKRIALVADVMLIVRSNQFRRCF